MKTIICLSLALIVTSCGPGSSESPDTSSTSTTNTITTVTTASPAPPAAPVLPSPTLTQANLDRIQNDMSPAEVEAILGQPSSSQSEPIPIVGGTQTTYTYQSGTSAVTVIFKNNQMKQKSGTFGP